MFQETSTINDVGSRVLDVSAPHVPHALSLGLTIGFGIAFGVTALTIARAEGYDISLNAFRQQARRVTSKASSLPGAVCRRLKISNKYQNNL